MVNFLPPRAAQLRVGPVPNINCPDKRASPYLALFLQGKKLNLAAIPPHLYREESRQKCSRHPGSGPTTRWRRLCQSSLQGSKTFALAALPRCQPQTAPGSTVRALISPESFEPALSWAVPAQAPEAVCHPFASVSSAVPESPRSPFHGAPGPAVPTPARPPPSPRSTSFRALWHWQTHRCRTKPPLQPARLRDCQCHRPIRRLASLPLCFLLPK